MLLWCSLAVTASKTGLGVRGLAVISVEPVANELSRLAAPQGRAAVRATLKIVSIHVGPGVYLLLL